MNQAILNLHLDSGDVSDTSRVSRNLNPKEPALVGALDLSI